MATTTYEALAREINRVTTSQYPSQLRTLRDLVQQCSDSNIAQWAASNPCVVDSLASCLIEGLQQWSYVLDIITKFAFDKACRDAFLRYEPTLLHSVVAQDVRNGPMRSAYLRASVALLSAPLPDTVALPAEVQTLFVQLVDEAASRPCTATIEPVYFLHTGTGSLLLSILSNETLIRFEEHLINILKSEPGTADLCLSLYCFSIMKVVCASVEEELRLTSTGSSYSTGDFLASTPTSSRWKSEAMQQFFTGSKAKRSIQLVVLLVLQGSSRGVVNGVSPAEKIKALVLANEVITAIPADLRKNWCSANATTIRKLQEKACAEGLDDSTRTLALRFLGKLCELDSLTHSVLEGIQNTFLDSKSVQLIHTLCPRLDDRELFASVLNRAGISDFLQNAVELAIQAESPELAADLNAMARSVRDARMIIEEQKITNHEICQTLNKASFTQGLHHLQQLLRSQIEHDHVSGWCPKALNRVRANLTHQISELLLRACHNSSTNPQNINLLLSLHAISARGDVQCDHERLTRYEHVRLGQGDALDAAESLDWREAIHTHFKARASVEQDAVTAIFAKACASLEARCEDVERPLRKEREKRKAVEQHNEELNQAFSELEARNVSLVTEIRNVEEERDQYLRDLEESRDENARRLERITELERKLREAHAEGERRLAEVEEAKQLNDLDNAAALAKKEVDLEDLQEKFERLERAAASKEQEVSSLQTSLCTLQDERDHWAGNAASKDSRIDELQGEVRELKRLTEDLESSNRRLSEDVRRAGDDSAEQARNLAEIHQRLQTAKAEKEEAQTSLSKSAAEAESIQHDLKTELSKANQSAEEERAAKKNLEDQLSELQQSLEDSTARLTSDLEARNIRVTELKKRNTHLQRKCEQKDQQISEAEAMRMNLMAAMGLNNSDRNTLPHRSRDSLTTQDATPPTPTSSNAMDVEDTQASQDTTEKANVSFESQGPTPKRPRPRRSIAAPSASARMKTRASMSNAAPAARSQGGKGTQLMLRRQTLGVVSGNASKGVMFMTPEKTKAKDGLGDDESTFDGSELFTGTQGARMAELDGGEF